MTVVLMAFRGDGDGFGGSGWRDRAYTAIRPHVEQAFPVVTADSGDEPFNISKSYNLAAEKAGDWDVATIHPPDEWVPVHNLILAADRAEEGQVYAFDSAVQLTQDGSEAFYEGARSFGERAVQRRLPRPGEEMPDWSGPRAVTRDLWERFGGFYEGLTGWGSEDEIFAHCCRVFGGPSSRVEGELVSLWHPRHDGTEFFGHYNENVAERDRLCAIDDPAELAAAL